MTQTPTRGQIQDLIDRRVSEDAGYRSELVRDPKGALERLLGHPIDAPNVLAVAEAAGERVLVVPADTSELSDADMGKVAGGLIGTFTGKTSLTGTFTGPVEATGTFTNKNRLDP